MLAAEFPHPESQRITTAKDADKPGSEEHLRLQIRRLPAHRLQSASPHQGCCQRIGKLEDDRQRLTARVQTVSENITARLAQTQRQVLLYYCCRAIGQLSSKRSSMLSISPILHSTTLPSGSISTYVGAATMPYASATLPFPSVSSTSFQGSSCSCAAAFHLSFLSWIATPNTSTLSR